MLITTRHGKEPFMPDIIAKRIEDISSSKYGRKLETIMTSDLAKSEIVNDIVAHIYDGITTSEIDDVTCKIALGKILDNPDYGKLAARIAINNLIKNINQAIPDGRFYKKLHGVLAKSTIEFFDANWDYLKNLVQDIHNYRYSHSGFYILQKNYLLREIGGPIVETPAMATLRVVVGLFATQPDCLPKIAKVYNALTSMAFTYATPVLFNSGCVNNQLSSCIIIDADDSLESIMHMISDSAMAQKYSSGIGMHWSNLRANNSIIMGTNGRTSGLTPLAEMTDKLGKYIDQGGGKRTGSISPYIADWHADLLDVLNLRSIRDTNIAAQHHGLFYAVWCSDLFFKQFEIDGPWYFMSPDDFKSSGNDFKSSGNDSKSEGLVDLYGDEFEAAYWKLVEQGKYRAKMQAREVWEQIIRIQSVAGVPYIVAKDNVNRVRNQVLPIRALNLCAEVAVPTNDKEIGVCNLASISLKKFVKRKKPFEFYELKTEIIDYFRENIDLKKLQKIVELIVETLDVIIDINFYPLPRAKYSNLLRRPMGIGVMGLADALCKLGIPFDSEHGCQFRAYMQEHIYYYAVQKSIELAARKGSVETRPGLHPNRFSMQTYLGQEAWQELEVRKAVYGIRNSVLTACMPTGSTSRIMNNSSCFEPYEANIYRYSAYASEQIIINKYLYRFIRELGFHKENLLLKRIAMLSGNIGGLELNSFVPNVLITRQEQEYFRNLFKTVQQIPMKRIIEYCAASQPFIDQSQSMNLWSPRLSINTFNLYNYGRKLGLKTLCYYHHSESRAKEYVCENCTI